MLRSAASIWIALGGVHTILATGQLEGAYAPTLREAGFKVFHIPFRKRVGYFRRVYRLMRDGGFDAVHIHTEQANVYYGIVASAAGVRRIVHTVHNVFPYTGVLRLVRIAMRLGLRALGATTVSVGASVAENEKRVLWNKTIVIPNWYDPSFRPPSMEERLQARQKFGIAERSFVIATVGNCNAWKNHSLLLEGLKLVKAKLSDWQYLHAGEEDAAASERLLVDTLGLTENCAFLGKTDDPRSVLWAADAFVMPSTREGLAIAALEAAACGLPLILTDVAGLRDLKESVPDGIWVPLDPSAMAEAIERVYRHSPSRSFQNALAVQAGFGMEAGARAYHNLYAGVRCVAPKLAHEVTLAK